MPMGRLFRPISDVHGVASARKETCRLSYILPVRRYVLQIRKTTNRLKHFAGCDGTFDSSKVLVSHIRSSRQHRESPKLRPEACLLKPDLSRELHQLPDIIPMYQVVPRKISKPSMEPDHHFRMGARVRHSFGDSL